MTGPSKVLLFGSFSEDETRSWLSKKNKNPSESQEKKITDVNILVPVQIRAFDGSGKDELIRSSATGLPSVPRENGNVIHYKKPQAAVDTNETAAVGNIISQLGISEDVKVNGNFVGGSSSKMLQNYHRTSDSNNQDVFPRGLINSGNLCFLNATLQALLSCPPFVDLLHCLRSRSITKASYPTIAAFSDFIDEVGVTGESNALKKDANVLETGRPFSPAMFETVLRKFSPDISKNFSGRPRQEDAQEFLSFLMDQMHDELLQLDGKSVLQSTVVSTAEDDGWETVGPKNKSAVTRTQSFVSSELSSIFGGQLQSTVKARGNKASATVQPFLLLHLDISHEYIRTIEDALHFFSAPETLNEYRTANDARKAGFVSARKSVNIQSLPKILILHLKRFGYGIHGSTKLHKAVHFPLVLILNRDLFVSATMEGRKYELVATITHHGNVASKGHYTADALRSNGWWLRFDDASIEAIPRSKVLHDHAYLLFYRQI